MTVKYKTVITRAGAEKLAAATVPNGKKVNFTAMAVGDGGGTLPEPDPNQTKLINERWRHALNKISQGKKNKNYVVAELVIPPERGGFWLRETGLYDDTGTLIAVGNMAESYKPELEEGSGRAQTVRMVIMVSDIDTVELFIDTTMVMATQDYVEDYVDEKLADHEQSRRHPDASLTAKGFTQLSSATDSSSETLAATPKAVKAAYDLASAKYTAVDATTSRKGIVQLSSATDSPSEVLAATPKAVKAAYDLASAKYTAVDATTARKGIVQLSSATDSSSEVLAATPKAVKAVNDNANSRVPSSRKVNNRALNADITLSAGDVDAVSASNGGVFNKTVRFNEGLTLRGNEVGDAGMVGIHPGADAASFTGANLLLESWYGIGFYSSFPADAPRGITGYIDVRSGRLEMKERVIPGNYANFDERYQAKGSYTPAGQAYTKAESDGRFQPKGSYTPAGQAYTKAESDSRFNLKNTASKAANGWEKDASTGMITQWGSGTYSKNARITFPVAFPNGCMVVVGNDTGSGVVGTALGAKDKTGFTMYANSTTVSLNWIAKGY